MTRFERPFVWVGGGLFVTSLAVCAYHYIFLWGRTPTVEPGPALVADALLFGLFAIHHSLFARERVKARLAGLVPQRLLRSVYVWTASLIFIAVCVLWQPIGGDVFEVHGWRTAAHVVSQIIGIGIIAAAVRTIDPLELAGVRPASNPQTLQITGPYRWVRHPVYLGWVLASFSAPHMTGDRLAFAAITSIYLVMAVPWEERSLMRSFGEEYAEYKRNVRWRIVPYVF